MKSALSSPAPCQNSGTSTSRLPTGSLTCDKTPASRSRLTYVPAQLEALNFSRHRFWKFAAESYFARHFVGHESCLHMFANFRREFSRTVKLSTQHNMRDRVRQALCIGSPNQRSFRNVRMAEQRVLHFNRRNPHTRDFQHVVRAAAVVEVAVRIAQKFVARHNPFAALCTCGQIRNFPISFERAFAAHPEISDFATGHGFSRIVNNFCIVARDGKTAAPRLAFPWPTGNKHVQHFRRANPVEDLDPESTLPAPEDLSGQGFSSRNAEPHG